MDMSIIQKCKLFLRNVMRKYRLKLIGNDFGNNLIYVVTKGNGSIFVEGSGHIQFRNEGDESRVKCIIHATICPGFFHHSKKILSK